MIRATPDSETTIRKAMPLLGTVVEITACGEAAAALNDAVRNAFTAIEKTQQLMSYHDPMSELSRVNHSAHRAPAQVSRWTFAVLRASQRLAEESGGAFDITVAPRLASWGYLPRVPTNSHGENRATWRDLDLLPGRRVAFRRPLRIDLGGIAKGFAVDRAVEALRAGGAAAGLVNAGGDVRAFGDRDWPVGIVHPLDPASAPSEFRLRDSAVATSATYFARKQWRHCWVCPLVDGVTRLPCVDQVSVSVQAPTALMADALTKVVIARREDAAAILQRRRASALVIDREGVCKFLPRD